MREIRKHAPIILARGFDRRRSTARPISALCSALLGSLVLAQAGCAIRYHDAKTGTEHLWGFAHMKMRVAPLPDAPAPAVATQTETFGLGLHFGSGAADGGFALGWDRSTRVIVPDDTALSVDWPTTDLFDVRIGRRPPFLPATTDTPAPAPSR